MRPLRINKKLESFFSILIDDELKKASSPISKARVGLNNLREKYNLESDRLKVISPLISDFKGWLLKSPSEHQALVDDWEKNYSNTFYRLNKRNRPVQEDFGKEIIEALHYKDFRRTYAKYYYEQTEVKTCPYCNCTLTVSIGAGNAKKARFQLDHYFPKVMYPLLSISVFNLIPSCASCNQRKSTAKVKVGDDFHLYANETPLHGCKFKIPKDSLASYLLSNNLDDIKIELEKGTDSTQLYADNFNKSFNIINLYDTQKDIIEELVWKSKAYNSTRIKELSQILKLDIITIKRLVVGNYIKQEEIHKRPMSKFSQDIAEQLKLI